MAYCAFVFAWVRVYMVVCVRMHACACVHGCVLCIVAIATTPSHPYDHTRTALKTSGVLPIIRALPTPLSISSTAFNAFTAEEP